MIRKKLLILTNRFLHNGPRIIREVNAFKDDYEIIVLGRTPPPFEFVKFELYQDITLIEKIAHKLYRLSHNGRLWNGRFFTIDRKIRRLLKTYRPDVVITHESEFFPTIFHYRKQFNFKVVYNAHEYHPLQFDSNEEWLKTKGRLYVELYAKYLCKLDLMVNVCDGIAKKCKEDFGVDSIVIPNACTFYPNIKPQFRNEESGIIKMIHHGGATRERKIEYMIEAVRKLGDRFRLDIILVPGEHKYINELTELVVDLPNINILPPVDFHHIVPFINGYDIGLFNLPPYTFNYLNALPNKLYEFVQARLCVVVSASPEMKKVVEENRLGLVSQGYSAVELADTLKDIGMRDVNKYKSHADAAAKRLSAEQYYVVYRHALKSL